jgi:hypothetical protein
VSNSQHAILSPSSASRWLHCPGSVALHAEYPDSGSEHADEGTAAHALAEHTLNRPDGNCIDYLGMVIPTDSRPFTVDIDMAAEVQKYVGYVRDVQARCDGELFVEQRLSIEHLTGEPGACGTSDAVILSNDGATLHVIDLKYGRGVKVDAFTNEQLAIYASAALREIDLLGDVDTVVMHIVMPRLGHIDTWELSIVQPIEPHPVNGNRNMRTFEQHVIQAAAHAITFIGKPSAEVLIEDLQPSDDTCQWCRAKATCPALAAKVQADVGADFETIIETGSTPTIGESADIAEKIKAVDLVEAWCKAVRAEAERRLHSGIAVPGYKLVEGKRGARAWTAETEAEEVMKSMRLKQDEMYDFKLISPTKAEKLLKESPKRWARLESLIVQKGGNPTVVPETDKRPALVINPAADFVDETAEDLV